MPKVAPIDRDQQQQAGPEERAARGVRRRSRGRRPCRTGRGRRSAAAARARRPRSTARSPATGTSGTTAGTPPGCACPARDPASVRPRCRRCRSPVGSRAWPPEPTVAGPHRANRFSTWRAPTGNGSTGSCAVVGGRPSVVAMAYYRSVGSVPPKRHTQHRDPDGHLYYEELMGEEGFSVRLLAALPPRRAVGASSTPRSGSCPTRAGRRTTRSSRVTSRCTRCSPSPATGDGACPVEGRRLVLGNNDVRIDYVVTGTAPSPLLPQRDRRRVRVRRVRQRRRRDRVRRRPLPHPGLRRWSRGRPPTAGCPASRAGSTRSRPTPTSRPPKRYLSRFGQLLEHAPYCERDLHGPGETFLGRGRPTSRCWSSTGSAARSSAPG